MSGYSTPPPPPGAPFQSSRQAYRMQRQAAKMQARAMKMQAKTARVQLRMQQRALRRRSIVGPLVLLTAGIVFLLAQSGHIGWAHVFDWYARWWPMVLIGAGLILVIEWTFDHRRMDAEGRPIPVRTLGGGVIFLLIVLALIGSGLRFSDEGLAWKHRHFGSGFSGLEQLMGDEHDADDTATQALAPGGSLLIRNPHGDVTVNGSSTDGQIHVSIHKQVRAWQQSEAEAKERSLQPAFSTSGTNTTLSIDDVQGGQADLTIQAPAQTVLTINAGHGDVSVNQIQGNVEVTANHGDMNVADIKGSLMAHVNYDDASVSGHNVAGPVTIEGRVGDVNFTDIAGSLLLQGDFFGTTHIERVAGTLHFQSSRTQFEATRLDGQFEIAGGPNLEADHLVGPVVLKTKNRNITLDGVQGAVQITNRNGSVNVTEAKPLSALQIVNEKGSVDVGLPQGAGFTLNAHTKNGDIENDFDLSTQEDGDRKSMTGNVAGGGPAVSITTTDGDVTVRKSSAAEIPPPPAPPEAPSGAAIPAAPAPPKTPKTPKELKVPKGKPTPSGVTF